MPPPAAASLNYQTPSTERVRIGFPMRLVAAIIDGIASMILIFVPTLVVSLIAGPVVGGILGGLLSLAYFSPEVFKAQSLGNMIFKFMITRQDGSPATQDQLIKRYLYKQLPTLIGIAAALPFLHFLSYFGWLASLVVIIGTLMVFQPDRLTLHDKLFGTAVYGPVNPTISIPQVGGMTTAAPPPPPPVQPVAQPTQPQSNSPTA